MVPVRSIARWTAEAVGIVLGTAALGLAVAYGLAHTEPGRNWIARNVASALSLPGESVVTIGGLKGILPDAIRLIDVRVSDPAGTWLTTRKVTLDWRPRDLFRGIFRVTALRIEDLEIQRIPPWTIGATMGSDQAGFGYLPFDAVVERLSVDDVMLGPEVLGVAARFRISGVTAATARNRLLLSFAVERTDGVAGFADFMALYNLADHRLTLDSNINEPAGGLAARLLKIPDLPPVVVNLNGDGPLNRWQGHLSGSLVDQAQLEAAITLRGLSPIVVRADGAIENIGSQEELPWRLLSGRTPFQISAVWRKAPSRRLVLDRARFLGTAADLEISGEFEPDLLQLDARSILVLKDDTILASLVDGADAEGITLGVEARGHLLRPEIQVNATARRLQVPGLSTEAAMAQLTFQPEHAFGGESPRGTLSGSGHFGSFLYDKVPQLEPVFGRSYAWQLVGQLDLAEANLWADQVVIQTERAEVSGSSTFDFSDGTMNADLEVEVFDLAGLGQLLRIDVQGNATLAGPLELRDFGRVVNAPLAGRIENVTLGEGISHALLQGDSEVEATLSVDAEINFWITDVSVISDTARLTGRVGFTERFQRMTADYHLAVADVGVLSPALHAQLAGSGLFEGQARGNPLDPHLSGTLSVTESVIAGLDFGQLQVDYTIEDLPRRPGGHLDGRATAPVDGLTALADYAFEGRLLHLSNVDLGAEQANVQGDMIFTLGDGLSAAKLTGRIGNLQPWLATAGLAGRGGAEAEFDLATQADRQTVRLRAGFSNLVLDVDGEEPLRVREARARLDTDDLAGGRDGRATLEAQALQLGDLSLDELSAGVSGNVNAGTLSLTAAGQWFGELSLSGSGRFARTDTGSSFELASLDAVVLGQAMRSLRAATFARSQDAWKIGDLAIDLGGARLTADARLDAERITADVETHELPVSLLGPLWLSSGLTGRVSGAFRLDGPRESPLGDLQLEVPNLRFGTAESDAPLALALSGNWRDGRLVLAGDLAGAGRQAASLSADLALHLDPETLALSMPREDALSGQVSWTGKLGEVWPLLPFPTHRLAGLGDLSLDLAGTLEQPVASGRLALSEAEYENLQTGTLLQDLYMTVELNGERLLISSLSANDGASGLLTGKGSLDLLPTKRFPFILETELDKFTLVRRDEVTVSTNGRLTIQGSFAGATLSGRMKTESVQLSILDQLPRGVVELDVIEIDSETDIESSDSPPRAEAPRFALALDLVLDIPRRAFLRGRGLESEWAGQVDVGGTLDSPQVGGRLELVRGQLSVFGSDFELSKGSVSFPDRERFDPQISVEAVKKSEELTVNAKVWGPARDPSVEISSVPDLPPDEIVSRLLFSKEAGQLTTAEAVQLAAALSELSGAGGGANVLNFARGALGIDVLRVETVGSRDDEQPGLSAGKYVTDEIFIDVKQGVETDSGSIGVEIEVTPNISIESDIGQTGDGNVGIKFKWDY